MDTTATTTRSGPRIGVRPLVEADLPVADAVLRDAFNTFLGVPDLFGDADYVRTRLRAAPDHAVAAELDGELVGSNFVTGWGSFGFFGPLSVRPDLWDQGVAQRLLEPTMDILAGMSVTDAGLFTFAHSAKHVMLYRRFGFWPQHLTFITAAPVPEAGEAEGWTTFSSTPEQERAEVLDRCAGVAATALDGLDLRREIQAAHTQGLGDTVLIWDGDLVGFAVCHVGPGSEAGSGACYVKFGMVRSQPTAEPSLDRLLDACFAFARQAGAGVVLAGANAARVAACETLFGRGFRTQFQGVAMQRGNQAGFNRADALVLDDWR